MRIPTSVVLVFLALLSVAAVQGATITIGPTQGHVEYRLTFSNQSTTIESFLLNESAQPTGQNGIVLVTANLISSLRNFTYSRDLNTSSFPEVFPYLPGFNNQSFSYHAYGVSITLHIVSMGNVPVTFNGASFQGTRYQVSGSATYPLATATVSANGTITTMPSGLVYFLQLGSINSYSVQMQLERTDLALVDSPSSSLPFGIAFVSLGLFGAIVFAVPSVFKRLKHKPRAHSEPAEPGREDKPSYWVD
jgi:hypothetical protein